ncbi:MAG: hypothetical protein WCE48_07905 [Steroidobacteraceae bacterium]
MGIAAVHNLRNPDSSQVRPFGVRVSLPAGDPLGKLLGAEWSRTHWYATAAERDAALIELAREHEYSRAGDRPALVLQKVENLAGSHRV